MERYLHHDFPNLGIRFIGCERIRSSIGELEQIEERGRLNPKCNEWVVEELTREIVSESIEKQLSGKRYILFFPDSFIHYSSFTN